MNVCAVCEFGPMVRPITFGCVAMSRAVLSILRSRLLLYSVRSGVNRVQVVSSGFSFVCAICEFGPMVRPITFGCDAMSRAVLSILRSRLILYSAVSGVNRVQVVLSGICKKLFCFVQAKTSYRYGCMYFLNSEIAYDIHKHKQDL